MEKIVRELQLLIDSSAMDKTAHVPALLLKEWLAELRTDQAVSQMEAAMARAFKAEKDAAYEKRRAELAERALGARLVDAMVVAVEGSDVPGDVTASAISVVDSIISDIRDRRGLKWEWSKIDEDIKRDIRYDWIKIVESRFA